MKFLKKLISFIAMVLIIGGGLSLGWIYFRNKQLFNILLTNSIVQGSLGVLKEMGLAIIAIFIGLVFLTISLKLGSIVRRNERNKKAARMEEQRRLEEQNRQYEQEAIQAKAEAAAARREAEKVRMTLASKIEEPKTEVKEEAAEEEKQEQ
ncbi:MAG: hypothetical protein IKE33_00180 [Erysipelotrichaceae bacterium]|nr:hypothetical protein [Erysipelotrichaceae bacterium]